MSTFFEGYGAVHCEMAQPTCPGLSKVLVDVAKSMDCETHSKGTYVCMEGPQFSTKAESLMHRSWGADLIGMTAMPEAKLAREAQMCYSLIALVTDYDCWKEHQGGMDKQALIVEILENLRTATENCLKLVEAFLSCDSELVNPNCSCRHSLGLAVWTDQTLIDPGKKSDLKVLFE